jgi:hypothetical protein
MLESIRRHQKLLQWLLLLLIFPSFAFFGIESYMRNVGSDADLIKVAGASITRQELDNAVKAKADNLQRQQGKVDSNLVNSVPFKQSVLNEIVQQRLLAYELKSLRLAISNDALSRELMQIPEIRALYNSGQFDVQRYKQLLANNGMTVDQFENGRRYDLLSRQALTSVIATGISSRKIAEKISQAFEAEREVQAIRFSPADYISRVSPTQKDLEAFYQANINAYQSIESVDIEYVLLAASPKEDGKLFAEKADILANMAYEQPDSLKPVADRLKLNIQSVKNITRAGIQGAADHPLNAPKLLAAVFSEDAIKNHKNIEAQEIGIGKVIVARVVAHRPMAALPFETVLLDVKKQVGLRQAEELAVQAGRAKFDVLQKTPDVISGFGPSKWVSRNKPADLTSIAMDAVMSVDPSKLPAVVAANSTGGGVTIYRVSKIQQPMSADPKLRANQAQQITQLAMQAEAASYFESVRDRASVKLINQVK